MTKPSMMINPPNQPTPAPNQNLIVTARVPSRFFWDNLNKDFTSSLRNGDNSEEVLTHYAWLVRTTSWSYGIDWDIVNNNLTTKVPFMIDGNKLDTTIDLKIKGNTRLKIDPISDILLDILKNVSLERVIDHFER